VDIIDPAGAVARELRRRLEASGLLGGSANGGGEQFWTTGKTVDVEPVVRQLWGQDVTVSVLSGGRR